MGNGKDALTVMATVTLAATKFPLYILGKGKLHDVKRPCSPNQVKMP